jgi:outer membrane immunogenic protein
MRFSFAVIALVTLTAAQSVKAADVPAAKAPPRLAGSNWSGCYLGANVGGIISASKISPHPGPAFFDPTFVAGFATVHNLTDFGGATYGGQGGCNWQAGGSSVVFAFELDFNGSSLNISQTASIPRVDVGIATRGDHVEPVTQKLSWFSTYRGRLGFEIGPWLLYGTGGLAMAKIDTSYSDIFPNGFVGHIGSDSRTRVGWTAGGGVEYALAGNWSVKAEYLYLDFGSYNFRANETLPAASYWEVTVQPREHIARAGLNYKFGLPGR